MSSITYPLDITGVSPLNLITDEQHAVTEANYWNYNFIIPKAAPFFITNLKVRHYNLLENRELREGIDYFTTLQYIGATRSIGKMLYGGITLNRTITSGIISIDYQTLGGAWVADRDYVLNKLAEIAYNPRLTVWETLTNVQEVFPPMDHEQDLDTLYGTKELIDAILAIGDVIVNNRDQLGIIKHLTDIENPHRVNLEQLGIPHIGNWGMATQEQIDEHVDTESLINPATLHYALTPYRGGLDTITNALDLLRVRLNNHIDDVDGHGLSVVRTDIAELANSLLQLNAETTAHINNKSNPHEVDKTDVGLSLVQNIDTASDIEVTNRDKVDKHVTLRQLIGLLEVWGGFAPTTGYSIASTTNAIYEGDTIYCTVIAPNSLDGELVYWYIGHVTTSDSDFVESSGVATILNGQAAFGVQLVIDLDTEVDEYFSVKLRKDSPVGEVVASTSTIRVLNTNSSATYNILPLQTLLDRGATNPVTVVTTDIPNGTPLYWTIEHISTNSSDFVKNNGVIQINSNVSAFTLETVSTTQPRTRNNFRVQIRLGSITGTVMAVSQVMYLKETTSMFSLMNGCCLNDVNVPLTVESLYIRGYKEYLPKRVIRG